ncbi:Mrp/NBP35 family ATP-binding protein [Aneurinibacillus danicus]|uniref:Iron-sulfur cluster carrier protein n=1 Tax=Aneurinibacillus danicus TaxID=267746 RepID=A0A511V799_9BACL|nr:Mrp/NBP35 family ATP-binding protein [Aneurinibacillus danicus]GEN34824.1 iron-sulfur cluster carrier protein [Aneurinibacillus danicus]
MITEEKVLEALKGVEDPELHRSVVELGMVRNIKIDGNRVELDVILTIQGCPLKVKIQEDVENAIKALGGEEVVVHFGSMTDEERARVAAMIRGDNAGPSASAPNGGTVQGHGAGLQQVSPLLRPDSKTQFIAVTSGKGGVGKSTVTVNLAVSLARMGKRVGVIDADIYGFSVPDMMGITQRPVVIDNMVMPVQRFGVKVISMGFFVEDNSPIIWRGPMLGKMLRNFFSEIHWGELDYMILDLPPGTGDVALDVHQMIPQSKEIIVTTPHPTAAFVAARAGAMAIRTNHEILGVVENMSYYINKDGEKDPIFGSGGGQKLAKELQSELLVQIPLGQPEPMRDEERYGPSVYQESETIGKIYMDLAKKVDQKASVTA